MPKKQKAAKAAKASKAASNGGVYKMTELVGTSKSSFTAATQAAVERACETLRNVDWFEVREMRGSVTNGKISQYQVRLAIGFRLD
jgi:flavin-binding protein dodecin